MQVLSHPYGEELWTDRLGLEAVPGRVVRSMRYKGSMGLADRGMMMGLGKRGIQDKGQWLLTPAHYKK